MFDLVEFAEIPGFGKGDHLIVSGKRRTSHPCFEIKGFGNLVGSPFNAIPNDGDSIIGKSSGFKLGSFFGSASEDLDHSFINLGNTGSDRGVAEVVPGEVVRIDGGTVVIDGGEVGPSPFGEFRSDAEAHIVFVEIKKPAGLKDAKRSAGILSKPSIGDIRSQVPFVFVVLHVVPNREGRRDIGAIEC